MKKYIMTDKGLREVNPHQKYADLESNLPYYQFERDVRYAPFPTGTIGQTYLESEIEFVEQFKPGQIEWQDFKFLNKTHAIDFGYDIRTIVRLRTPQVSEFEMGVMEEREKHIEMYKWLLGYYDFPEKPKGGRPAYWWRSNLREKLKENGIEIPIPEPYIIQP